jgi:hypothetical protein
MSTAVFTQPAQSAISPQWTARGAGMFWLLTIITGSFAMIAGRSVVVSGNAAATAANILAHEATFRIGIASDLLASLCYLAATILVYDLLKPVHRNVSLLAAFFSLGGCMVGVLGIIFRLAPIALLSGADYLSVFTSEQLQALAYVSLRMQTLGASFGFVFFGLHCFLVGYLILRSTFLPRFVGVLMVCAGLGWMTDAWATLLYPPLGRALGSYAVIPGLLGEGSLALWLLFIGVNVGRWDQHRMQQLSPVVTTEAMGGRP